MAGRTRDSDLAAYLKLRMRELGVTDGWLPAQNPSVNSGPDRGRSHASDRLIRHGDIIQIDFGIRVHGVWVADIQRFAYVLRPVGPGLNRRTQARLAEGQVFALDGFFAWTLPGGDRVWGNGSKTISVEEMVVITADGAEFLTPPQKELILIGR